MRDDEEGFDKVDVARCRTQEVSRLLGVMVNGRETGSTRGVMVTVDRSPRRPTP